MLVLEGVSVAYRVASAVGAGAAPVGLAAAGLAAAGLALPSRRRQASLTAIEGVDASFPEGSLTALVGPSGCGKTSLIQAMAGLVPPASGRILLRGEELHGVRERTAVIFQDGGLLPWKTVRDNAELPLRLRGLPQAERRRRVDPILEELGLLPFARFHPARLSGGMRQRLGVARALAQEADLLLMDEPFSSLDALTRESLQDGLLEIARRHRVTVILITHSIEEAAYLADRVYLVTGRVPGRMAGLVEWGEEKRQTSSAAYLSGASGAAQLAGSSGALGATTQPGALGAAGQGFRAGAAYFARCAKLRRAFEAAVNAAGGGA